MPSMANGPPRLEKAQDAPAPTPAPTSGVAVAPARLTPPPSPSIRPAAGAPADRPSVPPGKKFLPKACPACHARYPADFKVCPRDATPLTDAPNDEQDPLLGTTLGGAYQIVRVIGEGGMGRVYEARHTRLGSRKFAVKMLHAEYSRQPDVVARFQREAEAASGIGHPNVVDVFDVHHTSDGRPYLVGEFLEGEEFGDYLERVEKADVGLAVWVVRQVCRALAAAHAQGVVHRDMKPENVFLVGDPQAPTVKVIDFGISKVGDATGTALTRTGMIMGTPSYMAPEQARGDKVDHRCDIYAVGGILYRALTGHKPFENDDPSRTLTAVLTEDPPRPRSLQSSIPQALEIIIQRAMAKDPADRYQTMADLDADLAQFDPGYAANMFPDGTTSPAAPAVAGNTEPVEPGARTVLASAPNLPGAPTQLLRTTREAKYARPMIVLLSAVAYVWLLTGLVDALGGVVRIFTGKEVERTSALLITVGAIASTVTPLALWIRRLARGWGNSVRSVDLADDMRRVVSVAIGTSAAGALGVRLFEVMVKGDAGRVSLAIWSPALFVASLAGGYLAYLSVKIGRR
jgi:serine/threonine protein kinase